MIRRVAVEARVPGGTSQWTLRVRELVTLRALHAGAAPARLDCVAVIDVALELTSGGVLHMTGSPSLPYVAPFGPDGTLWTPERWLRVAFASRIRSATRVWFGVDLEPVAESEGVHGPPLVVAELDLPDSLSPTPEGP